MKTRSSGKVYEIDKIVDRKLDDSNNYLYRVRWKGYGAGHDSWRSLDELTNAGEAVADYEAGESVVKAKKKTEERKQIVKEGTDDVPSDKDEDEGKESSKKKVGKIAHFADNVEKSEQKIVGGNWQTVFEQLKG